MTTYEEFKMKQDRVNYFVIGLAAGIAFGLMAVSC